MYSDLPKLALRSLLGDRESEVNRGGSRELHTLTGDCGWNRRYLLRRVGMKLLSLTCYIISFSFSLISQR